MNLTRIGGALLAVALPFTVTGVAAASPDTSLTLTIATHERGAVVVKLECDPPGGSHPDAAAACDELSLTQGDFGALEGLQKPASCTMEFRPVNAAAHGTWRGKPVLWNREFSNPCTLRTATGKVFQF